MKKNIIILFILSITIQFKAQQKYSQEVLNKITQVENGLFNRIIINGKTENIYARMKQLNIKGLSIAVINDYKVEWAKGYGYADEHEGRKVDTNTLFQVASMSKPINALAILKLVQEGKIGLNTDVNQQLKSWQFTYDSAHWSKITPAHLLSHSAGLPFYGWGTINRKDKIPTILDILNGRQNPEAERVKPVSAVGVAYDYSNAGGLVLQQLYSEITNQPYDIEIEKNVLKPLGMTNSFFTLPPPANLLSKLSSGYLSNGVRIDDKFKLYAISAAGGLWSNPTDYAKYLIEMQLAFKGKSSKVLNQEMTKLHLSRFLKDVDATLGSFLIDKGNHQYFFHDGRTHGFLSMSISGLQNGKGLVIIANSDSNEASNLITELMNSITNVYNWEGWDKPQTVQTISIPIEQQNKYIGLYTYDGKIAEITRKKDGLYYWTDGIEAKMHFTTMIDFINIEFPSKKKFVFNDKGNVDGFERMTEEEKFPNAKKVNNLDSLNVNEDEFNNYGMYLLESRRLDDAIKCLTRGSILWKDNNYIKLRLAHGYLFKNQVQKAIDLYTLALNNAGNELNNVKLSLEENFEQFSLLGFDKKLMNKIKNELKF